MTREHLLGQERRGRGADLRRHVARTTPLGLFGPDASAAVQRTLARSRIDVRTGAAVRRWEAGCLRLADGVHRLGRPRDRAARLPRAGDRGPPRRRARVHPHGARRPGAGRAGRVGGRRRHHQPGQAGRRRLPAGRRRRRPRSRPASGSRSRVAGAGRRCRGWMWDGRRGRALPSGAPPARRVRRRPPPALARREDRRPLPRAVPARHGRRPPAAGASRSACPRERRGRRVAPSGGAVRLCASCPCRAAPTPSATSAAAATGSARRSSAPTTASSRSRACCSASWPAAASRSATLVAGVRGPRRRRAVDGGGRVRVRVVAARRRERRPGPGAARAAADPEGELEELAGIYGAAGLAPELAHRVAEALTAQGRPRRPRARRAGAGGGADGTAVAGRLGVGGSRSPRARRSP